MENEIKKTEKIKRYTIQKKTHKITIAHSAKSDTWLPGFLYNEVRIFLDRL